MRHSIVALLLVRAAAAAQPPGHLAGSSVAVDPTNGQVLVADADDDSIAVSSADGRTLLKTVAVGRGPEQIVVGPDGRAWVTLRRSGEVALLAPGSRTLAALASVGVEPFGLALAPGARTVYVTVSGSAEVVGLDADTLAERLRIPVDRDPRGIALLPDDERLFVTHLTGRGVTLVDVPRVELLRARPDGSLWAKALPPVRTIPLASENPRRVANLAWAIAPGPDGHRLFVPHASEDTGASIEPQSRASTYGAGTPEPMVAALTTVDAAGELARADPVADIRANRHFGGEPCLSSISQPRALAVDARGGRLFVAGFGSDDVTAYALEDAPWLGEQRFCIRLARGSGPNGLAVSPDGGRLYIHTAFDHQLQTITLADVGHRHAGLRHARLALAHDRLPAAAARGRRIFYTAGDAHQSASGRLPCASCHPEGRQDGLVWRLDDGPRQTPMLAGRLVGTAPYNWLGGGVDLQHNMTETLRRLGGSGLSKSELSDLELFLTRYLDAPPPVPAPAAALVARGKALFESSDVGCAHCHDPSRRFTDGKQHDIGTISREEVAKLVAPDKPDPRRGYNTPSLLGIARTAPYFHDGTAATLRDVLTSANPGDRMGRTADLKPAEVDALVAYLTTL
jgi:DNA-binding beta-propeller fold protein YncE